MAYSIVLTEQDVETIAFVGDRYEWSKALRSLEAGVNPLEEHEAWELQEAIEADMEGGHDAFPMLDPRSELAAKLSAFVAAII